MFDLSWSHILVVMVVAIVVIGPKDLPRVLRTVGRWTGKVKRTAREFQDYFNEALREAEFDTIQKEVEDLAKVDMSDVDAELAKTNTDIMTKLNTSTADPIPSSPAGEATENPPAAVAGDPAPASDAPPVPALSVEPVSVVPTKEPVAAEAKP